MSSYPSLIVTTMMPTKTYLKTGKFHLHCTETYCDLTIGKRHVCGPTRTGELN